MCHPYGRPPLRCRECGTPTNTQYQLCLRCQPHSPYAQANVVAHCGSWWHITAIPFVTPCCHNTLFVEVPDATD